VEVERRRRGGAEEVQRMCRGVKMKKLHGQGRRGARRQIRSEGADGIKNHQGAIKRWECVYVRGQWEGVMLGGWYLPEFVVVVAVWLWDVGGMKKKKKKEKMRIEKYLWLLSGTRTITRTINNNNAVTPSRTVLVGLCRQANNAVTPNRTVQRTLMDLVGATTSRGVMVWWWLGLGVHGRYGGLEGAGCTIQQDVGGSRGHRVE
jgi:hypothetical protein